MSYNLLITEKLVGFDRLLKMDSQLANLAQTGFQKDDFDPDKIAHRLNETIEIAHFHINQILLDESVPSWQRIMLVLSTLDGQVNFLWTLIHYLNSVIPSEKLNTACQACLEKAMQYASLIGQNMQLYKKINELTASAELTVTQQRIIKQIDYAFRLSGITLSERRQENCNQLQARLATLESTFEKNVNTATQQWLYHVEEQAFLEGIPDYAIDQYRGQAKIKNKSGYYVGLDESSVNVVLRYASSRNLRKKVYLAQVTRASDQFDLKGIDDNGPVIVDILNARKDLARILGYRHFLDRSNEYKMLNKEELIRTFLEDLAECCIPVAKQELAQLQEFACTLDQIESLEAWDIDYYREKLSQEQFSFPETILREYFPLEKVLNGLWTLIHRLFAIEIKPVANEVVWHQAVQVVDLIDQNQQCRGRLYLDLIARSGKRDTAWMTPLVSHQRLLSGGIQKPVAFITANFMPSDEGVPVLLTHDDVRILFHECGHALQHLLSTVDESGASGVNGVPLDAIEIPSLFFEHWCWEPEVLKLLSCHYQSGKALSQEAINSLLAKKKFHAASKLLERIVKGIFDLQIHTQTTDIRSVDEIQSLMDKLRDRIAVLPVTKQDRFQQSFSLIFSQGYAANYYGYVWSEAIASDLFAAFEEEGLFNPSVSERFLRTWLLSGGSRNPLELFIRFRARKPKLCALLRHRGILGGAGRD